uniref:Uncharacterized protein n=1 Tax=Oryza sativa subsp. japonica TaxID=39947 RepID=Q6K6H4_ORYSJ|nr:hypothetical protein [Oryza sativa Japonica Group]
MTSLDLTRPPKDGRKAGPRRWLGCVHGGADAVLASHDGSNLPNRVDGGVGFVRGWIHRRWRPPRADLTAALPPAAVRLSPSPAAPLPLPLHGGASPPHRRRRSPSPSPSTAAPLPPHSRLVRRIRRRRRPWVDPAVVVAAEDGSGGYGSLQPLSPPSRGGSDGGGGIDADRMWARRLLLPLLGVATRLGAVVGSGAGRGGRRRYRRRPRRQRRTTAITAATTSTTRRAAPVGSYG